MPTLEEIQRLLQEKGRQFDEATRQPIKQLDKSIDLKRQALERLAHMQQNPPAPAGVAAGAQIIPNQPQELAPNAPSMSASDQESRMAAAISANDAMAKAAAKLRAQAELDRKAEDYANELETRKMEGYKPYVRADQEQPKPKRFNQLQNKIQENKQIKAKDLQQLGPAVELTPEMEEKLFGKPE